MVTKVHQQTQFESGCLKVILDLCPVLVCEFRYRLELQSDLVITDEVRLVL